MTRFPAVAGCVLMLAVPLTLRAATITVTDGGSTYDLAKPCSAATTADLPGPNGVISLPEAVCAANNTAGGNTIVLGTNVTLSIVDPNSTALGGGQAGVPDVTTTITIQKGAGTSITRSSGSDFRMINVLSGGSLTLDGVTLSGGQFAPLGQPAGTAIRGGSIFVDSSSKLTVIDGAVVSGASITAAAAASTSSNSALGGGIYNAGVTVITGASVMNNSAKGGANLFYSIGGEGSGGAVYNAGTLTITNGTFSGNYATGGGGSPDQTLFSLDFSRMAGPALGGAICNATGATTTIGGSNFTDNHAVGGLTQVGVGGNPEGGAIYNLGTIPSIAGTTFDANFAKGSTSLIGGNSYGGAIYNDAGAVINAITGCTFTNNKAHPTSLVVFVGGNVLSFQMQMSTADCQKLQATFPGAPCGLPESVTNFVLTLFEKAGGNDQGGAIYTVGTIDQINGSTMFSQNEALGAGSLYNGGGSGFGGAIGVGTGGLIQTIDGATFDQNAANGGNAVTDGGDGRGGAIYLQPGAVINTISNCTMTNNKADGANGYPNPLTKVNFSGTVSTLKAIRKIFNSSKGGEGDGGAIYVDTLIDSSLDPSIPAQPLGRIDNLQSDTITLNNAYGGGGIQAQGGFGGGIYSAGNITINGGSISQNGAWGEFGVASSQGRGGGIHLVDQSVNTVITGTTIDSNKARGGDGVGGDSTATGGGIHSWSAPITLTNVKLTNNVAQGGNTGGGDASAAGGGLFSNGTVTISGSLIESNQAYGGGSTKGGDARGGGLSVQTNVTISQSRIDKNYLKGGTGIGGGDSRGGGILYSGDSSSSLNISDVTISGNVIYGGNGAGNCSSHGAGLRIDGGTVNVVGSTFSDNLAGGGSGQGCDGEGGGIYSNNGFLKVVNSTINGNKGQGQDAIFDAGDGRGGGIEVNGNQAIILNSTIADNNVVQGSGPQGYQDGGGIFVVNGSNVALFSTILYGNTKGTSEDENCWGNVLSLDYNIIGPSPSCNLSGLTANNKSAAPDYAPLANNGGPPAPDTPTFTRALLSGSPAINAGNCTVSYSGAVNVNNTVTTDQRGGTRVAPCDIGAYEFNATLTNPPSANPIFLSTPSPGPVALTGTNGATVNKTIGVQNVGGAGTALNVTQVSLSPGYTMTGLPINGLASGASTNLSVQCTVGSTAAGSLVVATNESPAGQYTYALTCANPAATAPLFASNPIPGSQLGIASDGLMHITVTNQGPAGTLLNVTNLSSNAGFTVVSGLPITGLASGQSASIVLNFDAPNQVGSGLLVLQTNEPGSPTYEFALPSLASIPTLSPWLLALLALTLGLFAYLRLRQ